MDMCKDVVGNSGITCIVKTDFRPPYGTGIGTGRDYEDIANAKPSMYYDEDAKTITIYTYYHDYHQPHFQMTGKNFIPAFLSNSSSVDIQMKFKNRKFIAREIGIKDWQNYPEDHCDTYQNQFYEETLQYISDED